MKLWVQIGSREWRAEVEGDALDGLATLLNSCFSTNCYRQGNLSIGKVFGKWLRNQLSLNKFTWLHAKNLVSLTPVSHDPNSWWKFRGAVPCTEFLISECCFMPSGNQHPDWIFILQGRIIRRGWTSIFHTKDRCDGSPIKWLTHCTDPSCARYPWEKVHANDNTLELGQICVFKSSRL